MRSPYAVLGVPKSADPGTIKSAYRSLAKSWHPDQNPNDPLAGSRFAEITQAYQILVNPELRERFDRGDIDARGRRRKSPEPKTDPFANFRAAWRKRPQASARPGSSDGAAAPGASGDTGTYDDLAGFDAMIKHIFGDHADASHAAQAGDAARRDDPLAALDALFAKWKTIHRAAPEQPRPQPQPNAERRERSESRQLVEVDLEKVLSGGKTDILLPDGSTGWIEIPAGIADGTEIRHETTSGDRVHTTVATIRHMTHPSFRTEGKTLHMDHVIELAQAVLGGHIVIPTLDGPARIPLDEWTTGGQPAIVESKGLPGADGVRGDLHVHLRIRLPGKPDPQLMDMMRSKRKSVFM
ncbi:J domain-containing protein [Pseudohoeflea suaedae]|uniref:J domain-containing protein n=1 Tax=Pseudohoeflea suaedae TaxID=877384 RepID=A0A4V3A7G6_9HYPH|nr:DnaJ domain-containing protein [Pseudohoeflea suaedae]TDH38675.1 J domain-containing protein [Pseudohoeflea suaedae]